MFINTTCTFHLIKALSTELSCLENGMCSLVVYKIEEGMVGIEQQIY